MAVAVVDTPGDFGGTLVSGVTEAYTNTGDCLVVGVTAFDSSASSAEVSTITFNGDSLSLVTGCKLQDAGNNNSELWRIAPPDVTTGNVVVTMGGNCEEFGAGYISFSGVHQSTPTANGTSASSASGAPTITVSGTTTADFVIDCVYNPLDDPDTPGANQTARVNRPGDHNIYMSTQDGADGGVMSWATAAGDWISVACRIVAAEAAPPASFPRYIGI